MYNLNIYIKLSNYTYNLKHFHLQLEEVFMSRFGITNHPIGPPPTLSQNAKVLQNISTIQDHVNILQKSNGNLQKQINTLNKTNCQLQKRTDQLINSPKQKTVVVESNTYLLLEQKFENLSLSVTELKNQMGHLEEENNNLKCQKIKDADEIEKLRKDRQLLVNQMTDMSENDANIRNKIQESNKLVNQLIDANVCIRLDVQQLQEQNNSFQTQLKNSNDQIQDIFSVSTSNRNIQSVKSNEQLNMITQLENKIDLAETNKDEVIHEIRLLKKSSSDYQHQLDSIDASQLQLQDQIDNLNKKNNKFKKYFNLMNNRINKLGYGKNDIY